MLVHHKATVLLGEDRILPNTRGGHNVPCSQGLNMDISIQSYNNILKSSHSGPEDFRGQGEVLLNTAMMLLFILIPNIRKLIIFILLIFFLSLYQEF